MGYSITSITSKLTFSILAALEPHPWPNQLARRTTDQTCTCLMTGVSHDQRNESFHSPRASSPFISTSSMVEHRATLVSSFVYHLCDEYNASSEQLPIASTQEASRSVFNPFPFRQTSLICCGTIDSTQEVQRSPSQSQLNISKGSYSRSDSSSSQEEFSTPRVFQTALNYFGSDFLL